MLVMLDLDNTLADRQGAVQAWVAEFIAERGLSTSDGAWILAQDRDGYADKTTVFEAIAARFHIARPVAELLAEYRSRVVELCVAMPGAASCLQSLRTAGCGLAIVSNGSSGQQHAKIDALGLRGLVDAVIVSGDLNIKKPDARIFQAAADATGLSLERSWMVGDSPVHDIVGAARCGIRTAWLHRGRTWSEAAVRPDLTLASLAELTSALVVPSPESWPR